MNTISPRVTVLMPVYNGLPYLKEAIESVLVQTFTEFEFLIIDDGSTDASVECIESYRDPRIRFVSNEKNVGQARTLNRGLELARGSYIARLDQDDVCLPGRLASQLAYMETHPEVAITCTWEHTVDDKGRMVRSWRGELKNYGAFLGRILVGKCPVWHPSVCFRRQVVVDLGGYDPSYAPSDDYELWARIALKRFSAAIVPEFLLLQRIHGGRQSVKRLEVQLANIRRAHENVIRTLYSGPEAVQLAALLRADGTFWHAAGKRVPLKALLGALQGMLKRVKSQMRLTPEEYKTLRSELVSQLGLGVVVSGKLCGAPGPVLWGAFLGLSPLLLPGVRRVAAALWSTACQLRYPRRWAQARLERWLL